MSLSFSDTHNVLHRSCAAEFKLHAWPSFSFSLLFFALPFITSLHIFSFLPVRLTDTLSNPFCNCESTNLTHLELGNSDVNWNTYYSKTYNVSGIYFFNDIGGWIKENMDLING